MVKFRIRNEMRKNIYCENKEGNVRYVEEIGRCGNMFGKDVEWKRKGRRNVGKMWWREY